MTVNTPPPSPRLLQDLARCSPPAAAFSKWFSSRKNGATETNVSVAVTKTGVKKSEILALFRLFEYMKLGRFVVGRHGYESRFVWYISPKSIFRKSGEK